MAPDVYVTSGSQDKLDAAIALGAKAGFNYREDGWHKSLLKASGGIDLVIDSGGGDGLHQVLDTLGRERPLCLPSVPTLGNAEKGLNMAKLFFKQIRIQGTTMGRPQEFRDMIDFINTKQIKPVIDHVYPFEDAVVAHKRMENSEQMGKLVLQIGQA